MKALVGSGQRVCQKDKGKSFYCKEEWKINNKYLYDPSDSKCTLLVKYQPKDLLEKMLTQHLRRSRIMLTYMMLDSP